MPLNRLSYLIKVPLALCIVSVVSALGIFIVTYYLLASYVGAESLSRVQQISSTLATSAKGVIARNGIWDAYQQVRAAVASDPSTDIVMISEQGTVLVASDPIKYPLATAVARLPSSLIDLSEEAKNNGSSRRLFALREASQDMVYGAATLVTSEDGDKLATVVVYSRQDATLPKLRDLLLRVLGYGTLALAVVISLGWWLGRSLVKPLNRLRVAMVNVGDNEANIGSQSLMANAGSDEIGQLTKQFISMNAALQRNRELEAQMQVAERMALAGKLAAGIAHEVNNPLGGMLNAISNLRRHGIKDPYVEKTSSLVERGLQQIQESITALMSQARREHTLLTCKDFDDLQMLSSPLASQRNVEIKWHVLCPDHELGIRSVPVRQIVLNLALNAISAALTQVDVTIKIVDADLHVTVQNDGVAFTALAENVPEPDQNGRIGLGLWVCFRLTQQLSAALNIQPTFLGDGTVATFNAPLETTHA